MNEKLTATQLLELIEACCREWFEAQKNEYEENRCTDESCTYPNSINTRGAEE